MRKIGRYIFDFKNKSLSLGGSTQFMTEREAELLFVFSENINVLVERVHVLQKLWGFTDFFNARSMDVFITRLRHKLKDDKDIKIINVRAKGYILSIKN